MPYGRITSSSGRTLNLSPEGWINNEGENLNAGANQLAVMLDYASPKVQLANGLTGYRGKGANAKNLYDAEGNMISSDFMMSDDKKRELQAFDTQQKLAEAKMRLMDVQSQNAGMGNKAPAGYRYTPDGNMEAIPGGPADAKARLKDEMKATGAADVDIALSTLRDAYDRLEKGGGITSTNKGPFENMAAAASSSAIGQGVGKMFGTDNQSARNDVEMTRPALLAALMKATGMSAKQMDSNAELKLWMKTATDPTLDVEANRRALANIEKKYLGGPSSAPSSNPVQAISEARAAIMKGAPREAVVRRLEQMGITNHGI